MHVAGQLLHRRVVFGLLLSVCVVGRLLLRGYVAVLLLVADMVE
jgi:hypothetical protein